MMFQLPTITVHNPVAEYLSFVDNGIFSVDGVLSDFPITPSEAIDCFSHISKNGSGQAKPLVISYRGASGDYPGCTDLAYGQAISDDSTTVAQSIFSNFTTTIPELQASNGIFTFSLTWSQIQSLTPAISNPYSIYRLYRNPRFRNAGKLMTLSEFLALTKNASSLSGVLINIENAAYLGGKTGIKCD
ncbi:hypothetical protein F0562_010021 [Nyssa sinensis]|uniref:glycerophosphodiester phosphodiesterase n=1 Tax=Nyssa sinensis TaxID=561372 RepID=A0A5J5A0X3_9ASTE|nr:hypothetical protein F0562_010021 [Nyssa sinensis]